VEEDDDKCHKFAESKTNDYEAVRVKVLILDIPISFEGEQLCIYE
jgi:hypothetical protein